MSNIETTDAKPDSGEREKIRTRANSGGSEDETDTDHLRQSVERTERMRRLVARRYQVVRHRPGSRMRCMRSCMRTRSRRVRTPICSTSAAAPGWRASQCPTMSGSRSSGMCANSIGSPRTWRSSTGSLPRPRWTIQRSGVCSPLPALTWRWQRG